MEADGLFLSIMTLKLIWGGSANTQPLQSGVDSSTIALDEESESAIDSSTDVENGTLHDQSHHESALDNEGDDLSCIDSPRSDCLPKSSSEVSGSGTSSIGVLQNQVSIRPGKVY